MSEQPRDTRPTGIEPVRPQRPTTTTCSSCGAERITRRHVEPDAACPACRVRPVRPSDALEGVRAWHASRRALARRLAVELATTCGPVNVREVGEAIAAESAIELPMAVRDAREALLALETEGLLSSELQPGLHATRYWWRAEVRP